MLIITHANILSPAGQIADGAVVVENGRIVAVGSASGVSVPPRADVLDAAGGILAPGFIDLQVNGAFGADFTADPAHIWPVAREYARYGVTAFLPTIITSPLKNIAAAQAVVRRTPPGFRGAQPLGLHVEGPFLNHLLRTLSGLFRRLKNKNNVPLELPSHFSEDHDGPEEHGHVGVVPAGMHHPRFLRLIGNLQFLPDREGIGVGPQSDRFAG